MKNQPLHQPRLPGAMKALSCALALAAFGAEAGQISVRITNITKGQVLTPPLFVLHDGQYQAFALGKQASDGLRYLAEDGARTMLHDEAHYSRHVKSVIKPDDAPAIEPGKSYEIVLDLPEEGLKLGVFQMLARTNDAFAGVNGLAVPASGAYATLLQAWDAGSEENTESCAHIPAPPCNNPNKRSAAGAEGFVHPHPGVQGYGDLSLKRDVFTNNVARIEIKRVH